MYEICIEELKLIPISKNPYACSAIIPVCQHSVQSCHAAIKNIYNPYFESDCINNEKLIPWNAVCSESCLHGVDRAKGSKESDLSVFLFRYEYSANFFYKLWKRIRKYNGLVTGLTQNVDELLRSDTARLMLANSEFLVMLNQSATDRAELAKLLNISDNQLGYVTNVPAGCGLIRCAGNIVPFTNSFPKNTKLYGLMTTKPDEVRKE